jgi:hypothetical protein
MARSGAGIFLLPGCEATAACMLYREACQVLIEAWILCVYEKIRNFDNNVNAHDDFLYNHVQTCS